MIIGSQGDDRIDVREMAATIGTIPWEIVCRIGIRIERVYTSAECDSDPNRQSIGHRSIDQSDQMIRSMAKPPRPSSSARSAARSRRSGSAAAPTAARGTRSSRSAPAESGGARRRRTATRCAGAAAAARLYSDIEIEQHARLSTGIDEFDRVLGGGIVPGSLVLLGGEPGIGKSTLLLQAAANMARTIGPVLYSSGEESEHQIKSRGERLGVGDAPLYLLAETCLERILEEIARIKPALVIVDSIQTVFSLKFQSAPGSIGQVREAATQLLFTAKGQNVPTLLVGHVTKDGSLAGPKALEHVVDTVLYFEGERHHSHRVVRAVKNRFGAVSELGVFEMTSAGLRPVPNPSKLFLAERPVERAGFGGAVLGRGVAADPGRSAGARQHAAPTAPPGGWPAASISSGCRCCWRCSRSAPAST